MEKITKEECLKFFNIFPNGNPEHVHKKLEFIITFKKTYLEDKSITLDYLIERYSKYIKFCRAEERESKYIKSPLSWLDNAGYNEEILEVETYFDKLKKNINGE